MVVNGGGGIREGIGRTYRIFSIGWIGYNNANVGIEPSREGTLDVVGGLIDVAGQLFLVRRVQEVVAET